MGVYYWSDIWLPNKNTIAYYPLVSDVNDHSGNGRNGTVVGTAPSYGTIGGSTINSAYLSDTKLTTSLITQPKTVNFWLYKPSNSSDPNKNDWKQLIGYDTDDQKGFRIRGGGANLTLGSLFLQTGRADTYLFHYSIGNWCDQWINICSVVDGNNNKLYMNGVNIISNSTGSEVGGDTLWIGGAPYNNIGSNYISWSYFSEIILESTARTAQEILDYFNQTKSQYGIS